MRGHSPDFFQSLEDPTFFKLVNRTDVDVVICRDCGHVSMFAAPETRARLVNHKHWTRIE